jgi:photosystem II stability/assembly factor-like uncharacterized protein
MTTCQSQTTYVVRRIAVLIIATAFLCAPSSSIADPPSSPGEMLEVAELNDLFFLDSDQGWAVGDRGAIWHTQNGGRSWQLADSPSTCQMESIHFCDPNHGWIVGGWIHPLTHTTSAAVLYTENGGRKWTRLEAINTPALKWVHFHSPKRGWAVGTSSSMYASGLLYTEDGGRIWNEMPIQQPQPIRCAAIGDQQQLFALGRNSVPLTVLGNRFGSGNTPSLGARQLRAIRWQGNRGWVVGDRGTVLTSIDGGRTWLPPAGKIPVDIANQFDWHTVETRGAHCWIAGSPGTTILSTDDGGATWQVNKTRHHMPLHCIRFSDDQHGWAAGSFGCILGTRDGGRTWRVQRKGAERMALAGIFSTADRVPWELYASASAENGHCSVVEVMNAAPDASTSETTVDERSHAAAVAAGAGGCTTAWRFPISNAESLLPLDRLTQSWPVDPSSSPVQALEEYIVRQIRMWRPDVIVSDTVSPDGSQPLAHLISQVTLRAARDAADPAIFPDQIAMAGLDPWSPKKVFTVLPNGQQNGLVLDLERLAVHLGCSLADYSAISRALISTRRELPPATIAFRLVGTGSAHDNAARDLFSGIVTGAIGETRRAAVANTGVTMETLGRALDDKRVFQLLTNQQVRSTEHSAIVLPQLDQVLRGRSPHQAGILLQRVAQRCVDQQSVAMAAAIEAAFVERFPEHIFSESSVVWLLRYNASTEWQRAFAGQLPSAAESTVAVRLPPPTSSEDPVEQSRAKSTGKEFPVQPASFVTPATAVDIDPMAITQLNQAAQWSKVLQLRQGSMFHKPAVQFQLASIYRRLGNAHEESRVLSGLNRTSLPWVWRQYLRAEQWLRGESPEPGATTLACARVDEKPYLDGVLNEGLWNSASPASLSRTSAETPDATEVRICHDGEFLYLAARCSKHLGASYTSTTERRTRDSRLDANDRIEFFVDVDRDYTSAFRFVIDYRGWTNDACDEVSSWNPIWHVAASNNESEWTIEAAIPLPEVDVAHPQSRAPWAITINRILPGSETQSFPPTVMDTPTPRNAALLLFR